MPQESRCRSILASNQISRRRLLAAGIAAAAMWGAPSLTWSRPHTARHVDPSDRILAFYNTHTQEQLQTIYWRQGEYIPSALADIDYLLRDHRDNELTDMDLNLLNLLYTIRQKLNTTEPFHVISGYRSAQTNAVLYHRSAGVDKNSLHMQGKAIDIRVPGYSTQQLRQVALSLCSGGVGYYARSDFMHIDLGPVRSWSS
jgi:uncharacterized protein YcbK (DUF882 family)